MHRGIFAWHGTTRTAMIAEGDRNRSFELGGIHDGDFGFVEMT